MEFTGERPTLEHEIVTSRMRYKVVIPFCYGKNTLDFGCGVGHGTYLLSKFTPNILGFDCSSEAIGEAKTKFQSGNLAYSCDYDINALTKNREIVVSIECIEHLEKLDLVEFIQDCSRLVPSFACTTPNGDLFHYQPMTLEERRGFHVWHYTYVQLQELFGPYYKYVDISGHAFDPELQKFTGYTVFATNSLQNWDNRYISLVG